MKKFLAFLLVCLILSIIISFLMVNFLNINLSEPFNKRYHSDELSFLKTFYLMEHGKDYYTSFKLARENLAGEIELNADTFTWRSPTIYLIWSLFLNNGVQIFITFVFLSLVSLGCSFLIIRKISNAKIGIVSASLLALYFIDTLFYKTAFLFTEWWGVLFIIFAFTALVYKHNVLTTILLTLAVLTREILVIPVLMLLILEIILRRKVFLIYLIPVIAFGIFYLFHVYFITNLLNKPSNFTLLERFHNFEWPNLQRMISFSMRRLVIFNLKTHYLIFILGIISPIVYLLFEYRHKKEVLALWMFILIQVGLFPLISVYENDYWGIMFMPLIIILAPIFLVIFKKDRSI